MILSWFKHRKSLKSAAAGLYQLAVAQSRDPRFYQDLGVSDTMDGRFDLISLHVFLIIQRLNHTGKTGCLLGQYLFDHMFVNMDHTLREIGVGDLAVPKHMKRMMKAFNGRVHAYDSALRAGDVAALELAVTRNIFRAQGEAVPYGAAPLAAYVADAAGRLLSIDYETFAAGRVSFPDVPAMSLAEAACA